MNRRRFFVGLGTLVAAVLVSPCLSIAPAPSPARPWFYEQRDPGSFSVSAEYVSWFRASASPIRVTIPPSVPA